MDTSSTSSTSVVSTIITTKYCVCCGQQTDRTCVYGACPRCHGEKLCEHEFQKVQPIYPYYPTWPTTNPIWCGTPQSGITVTTFQL